MILVLILSGIIIFIMLVFLFIMSLKAKINIEKIKISNDDKKIKKEVIVYLDIYFLIIFRIARIKIDEDRVNKIKNKHKNEKIDMKILKEDNKVNKAIKGVIKHKMTRISMVNLDAKIGLIDGILTSASVAILSTIVSIVLSLLIKDYKQDNINYKIIPIYSNEITVKIFLSCIIEVKLVHIIYMIYVILKKGSVKLNERTSNRRSYAYSYE